MAWKELKTRLCSDGLLSPEFLVSADERITKSLKKALLDYVSEHEPLLFEKHIGDVALVLDRALAFRREIQELEIQAVKAACDYSLFLKQSAINLQLDLIRLGMSAKKIATTTQQEAQATFGTTTSLESGFKVLAAGTAQQFEQELADLTSQESLLQERAQVQLDYQNDYWARCNEDGNAHNFKQRAEHIEALMTEDLLDCLSKMTAAVDGCTMTYARPFPTLPLITDLFFLDEFVLWYRTFAREIELEAEKEGEYDIVVPLVQPASPLDRPLVAEGDFANALTATSNGSPFTIEFDLPENLFDTSFVRIRKIGLSYSNEIMILDSGIDRNATADSYARYRAVIHTPAQKKANGDDYFRPPVHIGNVGVFFSAPIAFADGLECRNVNPIGRWKIVIYPYPTYKSVQLRKILEGIEGQPINDLKLHLRLCGQAGT